METTMDVTCVVCADVVALNSRVSNRGVLVRRVHIRWAFGMPAHSLVCIQMSVYRCGYACYDQLYFARPTYIWYIVYGQHRRHSRPRDTHATNTCMYQWLHNGHLRTLTPTRTCNVLRHGGEKSSIGLLRANRCTSEAQVRSRAVQFGGKVLGSAEDSCCALPL